VAIQLPIGAEEQFKGVVDLVEMKAVIWRDETLGAEYDVVEIPDDLVEKAKEYREKMIEAVSRARRPRCSHKFIEGQPITNDEIRAGIRKATIALKIFPVICGTAFKNKGVQTMLDAVVDYLPSPLDVPPIEGTTSTTRRRSWSARLRQRAVRGAGVQDHDRPVRRPAGVLPGLLGHAEERRHGVQRGQGRKERIGRLLRMHANKREEIQEILAGDICAAVG
jgi:elongation factor G